LGRIRLRTQSIIQAEGDEGDDNSRQTESEYVTHVVSRDASSGLRFGYIDQNILVVLWHRGIPSSHGHIADGKVPSHPSRIQRLR